MRPERLLFGFWALVCLPAASLAGEGQASRETPFVTEGSLLVTEATRVVKVPLEHTRVRIRVSGFLAEATVTQRFKNPYTAPIEAVYLFPLPTDAAVRDFTLRSGERVIRGRLLRRAEARAVYEKASAAGQVAALLTQERPNVFSQNVANLAPGVPVEVTLKYVSRLALEDKAYRLVFPMVVGPRYRPRDRDRSGRDRLLSPPVLPPDTRSAHDIDLAVSINGGGLPVTRVASPTHRTWVRPGVRPDQVELRLDATDRMANRDFELRYQLSGPEVRAALLTHQPDAGKPGHFLLMVQPPEQRGVEARAQPRELVFVIDRSSSMTGAPMQRARELVRGCLGALRPEDTFQMVRFAETAGTLGPQMVANRAENLKIALQWLDRLVPAGGTRIEAGLRAALGLPHDPGRLRLVVFISDGYVGDEEQVLALLERELGQARLFAFGVGTAVNRYLLEEMALLGRGTVQVVRPDEPGAEAVRLFQRRLQTPVLGDLAVRFEGMTALDLAPARLPDLFAGQPLLLHGRFTHTASTQRARPRAVVSGRANGQNVTLAVPLDLAPAGADNPPVALAWARQRIASWERRLIRSADPAVEQDIVALALEHRMLSRYTAFVAVDDASYVAGQATRVHVAVDRPAGLMHAAAGGTGGLGLSGSGYGGGGGYGIGHGSIGIGSATLHGHAVALPRVVAGQAVVMGSLDKDLIRSTIRSRLNEVRHCYEKELASNPGLAGKVVVRLTILEDGSVETAEVAASTLGSKTLEDAICKVVKGWKFPAAKGGGEVVVSYPFVFVQAQQEKRP